MLAGVNKCFNRYTMAFVTCITSPPQSLGDYHFHAFVTLSQLLQTSWTRSNSFLLCVFIAFNMYIPYSGHHVLLVMGVICMHVISPRRCNNCQTLSPHSGESLGAYLWVAHTFPLAIIKVSYVAPGVWSLFHHLLILISCFSCSHINLVTLRSLLISRRAVRLFQPFIALFGCLECKACFPELAWAIFRRHPTIFYLQ